MLALLVGGVAVGIHILHKDALAVVVYTVEIWDDTVGDWLEGGTVWFSFDQRLSWEPTVENEDGQYIYISEDWEGSWWIWLWDPQIAPPIMVEGSATHAFHHWDVETEE